MVVFRGQLDPVNGALLRAALDFFAKPQPAKDGQLPIPDGRSARERRADAMGAMCRHPLDTLNSLDRPVAPNRPKVVIHVPADGLVAECEQTGPISQPLLGRYLCDATLQA